MYILITVSEREIIADKFDTFNLAFDGMCLDFAKSTEISKEELDAEIKKNAEMLNRELYVGDACQLLSESAWSNQHSKHMDWKIFEI